MAFKLFRGHRPRGFWRQCNSLGSRTVPEIHHFLRVHSILYQPSHVPFPFYVPFFAVHHHDGDIVARYVVRTVEYLLTGEYILPYPVFLVCPFVLVFRTFGLWYPRIRRGLWWLLRLWWLSRRRWLASSHALSTHWWLAAWSRLACRWHVGFRLPEYGSASRCDRWFRRLLRLRLL